jgi:hypothetical protein
VVFPMSMESCDACDPVLVIMVSLLCAKNQILVTVSYVLYARAGPLSNVSTFRVIPVETQLSSTETTTLLKVVQMLHVAEMP